MFHQILILFFREVGINGVNLLQGQPPLHAPLMALGCGAGPLCWASGGWGAGGEVEGTVRWRRFVSGWFEMDIYIYMKTMNFQGAMIHNLECVSRDFFLEVIQNLWIFGCFPKKLGRFRMSEQKPCLRERMVVLPGRCSHCVWGWPCRWGAMYSTTRPCVGEGPNLRRTTWGPKMFRFEDLLGTATSI